MIARRRPSLGKGFPSSTMNDSSGLRRQKTMGNSVARVHAAAGLTQSSDATRRAGRSDAAAAGTRRWPSHDQATREASSAWLAGAANTHPWRNPTFGRPTTPWSPAKGTVMPARRLPPVTETEGRAASIAPLLERIDRGELVALRAKRHRLPGALVRLAAMRRHSEDGPDATLVAAWDMPGSRGARIAYQLAINAEDWGGRVAFLEDALGAGPIADRAWTSQTCPTSALNAEQSDRQMT
jgi:hypothetical protein